MVRAETISLIPVAAVMLFLLHRGLSGKGLSRSICFLCWGILLLHAGTSFNANYVIATGIIGWLDIVIAWGTGYAVHRLWTWIMKISGPMRDSLTRSRPE